MAAPDFVALACLIWPSDAEVLAAADSPSAATGAVLGAVLGPLLGAADMDPSLGAKSITEGMGAAYAEREARERKTVRKLREICIVDGLFEKKERKDVRRVEEEWKKKRRRLSCLRGKSV